VLGKLAEVWHMCVENKEEVYAPIFRWSAVNWTIESEHAEQGMLCYEICVLKTNKNFMHLSVSALQ
jgi:hypothetical protein